MYVCIYVCTYVCMFISTFMFNVITKIIMASDILTYIHLHTYIHTYIILDSHELWVSPVGDAALSEDDDRGLCLHHRIQLGAIRATGYRRCAKSFPHTYIHTYIHIYLLNSLSCTYINTYIQGWFSIVLMLCYVYIMYVCMYVCMNVMFFYAGYIGMYALYRRLLPASQEPDSRLHRTIWAAQKTVPAVFTLHTYIHKVHTLYVMVVDFCICKCYECIRLTRLCNGSCMYVLYVCFFYFVRLCWQSLCCGGWATSSLNTRRWIPRSSIHPMRYVCM